MNEKGWWQPLLVKTVAHIDKYHKHREGNLGERLEEKRKRKDKGRNTRRCFQSLALSRESRPRITFPNEEYKLGIDSLSPILYTVHQKLIACCPAIWNCSDNLSLDAVDNLQNAKYSFIECLTSEYTIYQIKMMP